MQKITADSPDAKSADLVAGNLAQLKTLFPEAWAEGKLDFDVLRQLLGGAVDDREEKYGLNWHGKKKARQIALTPSTGTLRPCPADSVDWDTTQNLMIEGDNLEVLKLLQKSYAGKVKMIYIDPPYNTGKDFVYPDNFQDNIKNYLELTGQLEGGVKFEANADSSGRFHTDWLNMIYPRIKLARNLLRDDGLLFVSIDDNEAENMKIVLNELFGEENFLAQIIWQKMYSGKADATHFGRFHEYILCYSKNSERADVRLLPRTEAMDARYTNPDNDPRGPWLSNDLTAAGERSAGHFEVRSPSGKCFDSPQGKHWLYSQETIAKLLADNRIYFGRSGDAYPRLKRFLTEVQQGRRVNTIWLHDEVGHTDEGTKEVKKLFPSGIEFQAPKPTRLIKQILSISIAPKENDIVLDFFAGSGTTTDAVYQINSETSGNIRFITVQIPEPINASVFPNIAKFTEERLRRVINRLKTDHPLFSGDLGFRVYKLDSSNIREWEPKRDDLAASLEEHAEHLKTGRTEADILTELLLKLGLDLCVPIEVRTMRRGEREKRRLIPTSPLPLVPLSPPPPSSSDLSSSPSPPVSSSSDQMHLVHSIGAGALFACLAESITAAEVEPLAHGIVAWHAELRPAVDTRVVFRDSAFADDVAKTNLAAILEQHGLKDVRSL